MTMEFEELQQVWDKQNDAPMYVINEEAMYRIVVQRKNQVGHMVLVTEVLSVIVNAAASVFVLSAALGKSSVNIFLYVLSAWMLFTAIYVLVVRIDRMKGNGRFDRSIRGELELALSMATHQVRLSHLLRWNIVPMALFVVLGLWTGGKSTGIALAVSAFFALAFLASGWEHSVYKRKKQALEVLKEKLDHGAVGVE